MEVVRKRPEAHKHQCTQSMSHVKKRVIVNCVQQQGEQINKKAKNKKRVSPVQEVAVVKVFSKKNRRIESWLILVKCNQSKLTIKLRLGTWIQTLVCVLNVDSKSKTNEDLEKSLSRFTLFFFVWTQSCQKDRFDRFEFSAGRLTIAELIRSNSVRCIDCSLLIIINSIV